MIQSRREYSLSSDQPILKRARARRRHTIDHERAERDFWRNFDLDKLARPWHAGVAHPA